MNWTWHLENIGGIWLVWPLLQQVVTWGGWSSNLSGLLVGVACILAGLSVRIRGWDTMTRWGCITDDCICWKLESREGAWVNVPTWSSVWCVLWSGQGSQPEGDKRVGMSKGCWPTWSPHCLVFIENVWLALFRA